MDTLNPFWNLMQVFAWVYSRDWAAVKRYADTESERIVKVQSRLPDGRIEWIDRDVGPYSPASLIFDAAFNAAFNGAAFADNRSAKTATLNNLIEGRLACYAIRNDNGDPEQVPLLHWLELDFYWDRNEYFAGPRDLSHSNATRWYRLRFPQEQVLKIWPDPLATQEINTIPAVQSLGYAGYLSIINSSWQRPDNYSLSDLKSAVTSSGKIWLKHLINFLAFGTSTEPPGIHLLEEVGWKYLAAKVVFAGAGAGNLTLVHSSTVGANGDAIDASAFDFKLKLGAKDNSIEADLDDEPAGPTSPPMRYLNVRVQLEDALQWLAALGFGDQETAQNPKMRIEDRTKQESSVTTRPGRKVGTVNNLSELKVVDNLVQRFRKNPELQGLPGKMIVAAAVEEGFVMPSQARQQDAFEKRMRSHLMNYSDIAPRISKNRQ